MFEIVIKKDIQLKDLDTYYKKLYSHIDKDIPVDLVLPSELENYYFGLIPSLYQFAVTWMRYKKSGKLRINVKNPTEEDLARLHENELLFPIISLVWNKNGVYDSQGKNNLRLSLKPFNTIVYDKMVRVDILKGKKLVLVNFDHLPPEKGLLPCFERDGVYNDDEPTLHKTLKNAMEIVVSQSLVTKNEYKNIGPTLISIINELMKNTFQWAKSNENNVPLNPNLRGVLIKYYSGERQQLLSEFKHHKGLYEYFSSNTLLENSTKQLYFLEVSVFDSGSGFVKKYRSNNKREELNDYQVVKECLIKHMTSAKGLERDDKGIGLDKILRLLNKKGFLRIKTGKVCVYRNMIANPYKPVGNVDDMELFDWDKHSNKSYTDYLNSEGAVVTIVYPLLQPDRQLKAL